MAQEKILRWNNDMNSSNKIKGSSKYLINVSINIKEQIAITLLQKKKS